MHRREFITGALTTSFVISMPSSIRATSSTQHIPRTELLSMMSNRKRKRPLIAVVVDNHGSEVTDTIIPWSILKRSGLADVHLVSTQKGAVQLMPALKVQPDLTIDQFDQSHPNGADYVIMPALHNPKNKVIRDWLRQQSNANAIIMGICAGALPIAYAGLLEHKRATTHWYDLKRIKRISPNIKLMNDLRYVADHGVITTTGVSASLPAALTLVEAIGGRTASDRLGKELGIAGYDNAHASGNYQLTSDTIFRAIVNKVNIIGKERIGLPISDRMDEISIALMVDAWSRTYRSRASTIAQLDYVKTLNGLTIIPDMHENLKHVLNHLVSYDGLPGNCIDQTLLEIKIRYGKPTAKFVALQLEYPWKD